MSILPNQSEVNPSSDFWLSADNIKNATAPFSTDGSAITLRPITASPLPIYAESFLAPDNGTIVVIGSVSFNNQSNGNDRTFTLELTDGVTPASTTVRNVGNAGVIYSSASTIFTKTVAKDDFVTLNMNVSCDTPGTDVFYGYPGLQCIFSPS
jgi:hypothetical protein